MLSVVKRFDISREPIITTPYLNAKNNKKLRIVLGGALSKNKNTA